MNKEFRDLLISFKDSFSDIESDVKKLQKKFEKILKDKSIPLDLRWEIFSIAPKFLSHHNRYLFHFPREVEIMPDGKELRNYLYDDHQRGNIKALDIVERLEGEQWKHDGSRFYEKENYVISYIDKEYIDKVKEALLEANTKSWDYDW